MIDHISFAFAKGDIFAMATLDSKSSERSRLVVGRRGFVRSVAFGALGLCPGFKRFSAAHLAPDPVQPQVMESSPGPMTMIDGKPYHYFGGTSYYCLHGHPELIRAGIEALHKYGLGTATSREGFGNNPVLLAVEQKVAEFFGTETAAYFVSGYLGNMVLAQGLSDRYDVIFMDEMAHFSVQDGAYSSRKQVVKFRHRDPEDLARKLKRELKASQHPFVISDGIFPTFGVIAPAADYARILAPYEGILCLDDNHGVGVLGPNGRGTLDHFGLQGDKLFFGGTLSKAFGSHGGFITGTHDFIDSLKARVGVLRGSSPTPNPGGAAAAKGVEILLAHPELRERLRRNIAHIKSGLRGIGFAIDDTPVPIAAWSMGTAGKMKSVQIELYKKGIAIRYSNYVGAPAGGILRASIFSEHTPEQIDLLLGEIRKLA